MLVYSILPILQWQNVYETFNGLFWDILYNKEGWLELSLNEGFLNFKDEIKVASHKFKWHLILSSLLTFEKFNTFPCLIPVYDREH